MKKLLEKLERHARLFSERETLDAREYDLEYIRRKHDIDPEGKYKALRGEIGGFLQNPRIINILRNLTVAYPGVIEMRSTSVLFRGVAAPPIAFSRADAADVAKKCIYDIQFAMQKILVEKNSNEKLLYAIAACYNTLLAIFAKVPELAEEEFKEKTEAEARSIENLRCELDRKTYELGDVSELISEGASEIFYKAEQNDDVRRFFERKRKAEENEEHTYTHTVSLGSAPTVISKDLINYVSKLDFDLRIPLQQTVYIFAKRAESSAFIDTHKMSPSKLYNDLYAIFLNAVLEFEPKGVTFAFVETRDASQILSPICDELRSAYSGLLYIPQGDGKYKEALASERTAISNMIDSLYSLRGSRESTFMRAHCADIGEYNTVNLKNPMEYVILTVNGYPDSIPDIDTYQKLVKLMEIGGDAGIFVIILGKNSRLTFNVSRDPIGPIPLESIGAVDLYVDGGSDLMYKGRPFHIDTTSSGMNFDAAAEYVAKRISISNRFMLSSIAQTSHDEPFENEVSVPVGDLDGKLYSITTSTDKPPYPFMVVTGSTGRGKSAFLHEFIMSTAMKYSPDEVQFYIIDFKASENAQEFLPYKYEEGVDNLYVPHIKFLSLSSKAENALDVINFINNMINERNRLGYFAEYNRREEVKCGKKPKMPRVYFLIDEYERMLKGGDASSSGKNDEYEAGVIRHKIEQGITAILKIARTYGIGLIFSGQNITLGADALGQINHRICFYNDNQHCFETAFGTNWSPKYHSLFTEAKQVGYAFCASSASARPELVRMAYAGNTDKNKDKSQAIYKLARKIREKYKDYTDHTQIIVGDTGSAEIKNAEPYRSWNDEIEHRISAARLKYAKEEDFLSSGLAETYRKEAPVAIGISQTGSLPVTLDFKAMGGALGYLATSNAGVLRRIEQNTALAFLYQVSLLGMKDKRIIYLEGSRRGFDSTFGDLISRYPFLSSRIEHVSGEENSAHRLIELAAQRDAGKRLVIIHGLDWLDDSEMKKWLEALAKKSSTSAANSQASAAAPAAKATSAAATVATSDFAKQMAAKLAQAASMGIDTSRFQMDKIQNSGVNMTALEQKTAAQAPVSKERARLSAVSIKEAFTELYLRGSERETFVLCTSDSYKYSKNVVLGIDTAIKNQLFQNTVFGSFDEMQSAAVDPYSVANTAYVTSEALTVRLYDYNRGAEKWWDALKNK